MQIFNNPDFIGNNPKFFTGVVEDNADPLTIGRVKVRVHVYHTDDKSKLSTSSLPWALVMQPTTSAAISGIGQSPNGLLPGSWVFGMWLDDLYQQPLVLGSLPGVHRPQAPGTTGNTDGSYLNASNQGQYGGTPPYHGQGTGSNGTNLPNSTDGGNSLRDSPEYLSDSNKSNWPLKYYTSARANAGGLACNGTGENRIHKSTALALEELTSQWGKGKLRINSAYRSPSYNARVGGARGSQHMQGRAFDISLASIGNSAEQKRFATLAAKNGFVGFGLYNSFMHIDTGTGRTWLGANASDFQAALRAGGWFPGKKGLNGVKTEPKQSSNTTNTQTANTTPTSTSDGKTVKDGKTNSVSDRIDQRLKDAGYSDAAIAAVKAHGSAESGLDPSRINPNDKGMRSVGMFQWRDDRDRALQTYAAQNGKAWNDTDTQIDYFLKETGPGGIRSAAGAQLRNAKTPEEAHAAMSRYEGYQGWNNPGSKEYQARLASTNKIYGGGKPLERSSVPGFHDPTNSLPYGNYKGKPSTNEAARGLNANVFHANHMINETGKMTGLPMAGNRGTFGEPENSYAPQYPHNNVTSTKSGHTLEMDDTPGAERIQITHKSGSTIAISAKGSMTQRVLGNSYRMDTRDSFHGVQGDYNLTAVGDLNMRSTTDITIQSDGSKTELVYNDRATTVSGNFDILVGETVQIKATKIVIEANDIDIYSKGNMTIQSEGDLNLKGKNVNIEASAGFSAKAQESKITSSGDTSIKGSTVFMDDIVKMAEGGAKDAPSVKDATSTDLGKAAGRKKIKKNATPSEHPDSYVTTEESMTVYST